VTLLKKSEGASQSKSVAGRVLFVIDTLEVGGAERSIIQLAARLGKERAVVCQLYPGSSLAEGLRLHGIPHVSLDLKGKYSWFAGVRGLRQVLNRYRPAVVHSTLFRADIISRISAFLSGYPLICSLVNDPYSLYRWKSLKITNRVKLAIVLAADLLTSPLAHRYISNSKSVAASNGKWLGIPQSKISVIHRGRDLDKYAPPLATTRARKRKEYGVSNYAFVWVVVCRLIPRKSVDTLLRAVRSAKTKRPECNIKLWILGDGCCGKDLRDLCERLALNEHVTFLGNIDNVIDYLVAADGALSASFYEGLPGALIEAMAVGLPIVASDISMHRELAPDVDIGYFFQIKDSDACAQCMLDVMDNPLRAREFGKSARALAKEKFDISSIVEDYIGVYRSVSRQVR